jgi:hypothetical protein
MNAKRMWEGRRRREQVLAGFAFFFMLFVAAVPIAGAYECCVEGCWNDCYTYSVLDHYAYIDLGWQIVGNPYQYNGHWWVNENHMALRGTVYKDYSRCQLECWCPQTGKYEASGDPVVTQIGERTIYEGTPVVIGTRVRMLY